MVLVIIIIIAFARRPASSCTPETDIYFGDIPYKDVVWTKDTRFTDTQPKVFYNESGADERSAWSEIYPSGWVEVQGTSARKLVGGAPLEYWGSELEEWEAGSQAWATTLMHQIHCLGMMKSSWHKIESGEPINNRRHGHFPHCIEYLRQAVMCQADLTLEPAMDPMHWPIGTSGWDVTHRCKDWDAVLDAVKQRAVLRDNENQRWYRMTPRSSSLQR
ncbi:hypothetical protein DOTSEDRAFT_71978 [Dothistroma septosporum NZE10]|uniref:Uncharacterized protein n=1 Tax=Dothistroma septosporum (strain NZE10 / CBS 128990) TaxID=675120 RepID=N1PPG3_DOTSN|nr:hypothetical protein DOTSEDRAFT_71978 [Dothistroma septosporum NZE10]